MKIIFIRKEIEDKLASIIVQAGTFNIGKVFLSGISELSLDVSNKQ
jgi:hypothetical protein